MDVLEEKARDAMASLGARRPRQRIPDTVREAVLGFAELIPSQNGLSLYEYSTDKLGDARSWEPGSVADDTS